ncbi:MAG: hypothetical protein ABIY70_08845 [Capsulimonas sp.]|uniref:hypothetical protein n=1 Tax=Capsulimonas sp. TaxID=2494211 RepID=UPI0032673197
MDNALMETALGGGDIPGTRGEFVAATERALGMRMPGNVAEFDEHLLALGLMAFHGGLSEDDAIAEREALDLKVRDYLSDQMTPGEEEEAPHFRFLGRSIADMDRSVDFTDKLVDFAEIGWEYAIAA